MAGGGRRQFQCWPSSTPSSSVSAAFAAVTRAAIVGAEFCRSVVAADGMPQSIGSYSRTLSSIGCSSCDEPGPGLPLRGCRYG